MSVEAIAETLWLGNSLPTSRHRRHYVRDIYRCCHPHPMIVILGEVAEDVLSVV
jgi:hypothetical protein